MLHRIFLALAAGLAVGGPAWGGEPPPAGSDDPFAKRCWIEPWYCKDPPDNPPVVDPAKPSKPCWIEPWYCKSPRHPRDIDPAGPDETDKPAVPRNRI